MKRHGTPQLEEPEDPFRLRNQAAPLKPGGTEISLAKYSRIPPEKSGGSVEAKRLSGTCSEGSAFRLRNQAAPLKHSLDGRGRIRTVLIPPEKSGGSVEAIHRRTEPRLPEGHSA